MKLQEYFSRIMMQEGDPIQVLTLNPPVVEGLVWVESGLAKVYGTNEKGLKINTDLIFRGEFFLVNHTNYQSKDMFFLESMKNSFIRFLPLTRLDTDELASLPTLMLPCYQDRLKRIHQQKVKNFDLELEERVFFLLFDFCLLYGHERREEIVYPNFFTHDDLAGILRNCRQNITACLNELKRKGLIAYNRKEIMFPKEVVQASLKKYYGLVDWHSSSLSGSMHWS